MATKRIPTPDELRKLLRYDAETGKLFWLDRTPDMFSHVRGSPTDSCRAFNNRTARSEAFTAVRSGYRVGNIFARTHAAHRVIWAIVTGKWPEFDIDHIDGDRANNRIENLRDVPRVVNLRNTRMRDQNTSGITGVYWNKHTPRWSAKISVGNKSRHLGYFDTKEEAQKARKLAEARLGFSATHGTRR